MGNRGDQTPVVLALIRNRIEGLLLKKFLVEANSGHHYAALTAPASYIDSLQESANDEEFLDRLRSGVVRTGKSLNFFLLDENETEILSSEFGNILWAELSDKLIATTSCQFANFGKFYRSSGPLGLTIGFEPTEFLVRSATRRRAKFESLYRAFDPIRPLMVLEDTRGPSAAEIELSKYCLKAIEGLNQREYFEQREEFSPEVIGRLLHKTLPRLVSETFTEFESNKEVRDQFSHEMTLLTTIVAICTYYLWFLCFANGLSSSSTVTVTSIGVFHLKQRAAGIISMRRREWAVLFEAGRDFSKLISVGLPPTPAKAA
jgi:hypothetical protein